MPQSLAQIYLHITYSTKHRQPFLAAPAVQPIIRQAPRQPDQTPGLLIEDHQTRTVADGDVQGTPVRLERSQSRLVLLQKTETGALRRTQIELPAETTVRSIPRY